MTVEILYVSGCPNQAPTVNRVRAILQEEGIPANIVELEVTDALMAQAVGFLGSPTIRINGQDIEPPARASSAFGFTCRIYIEGGKRTGVPSAESIRAALRDATA